MKNFWDRNARFYDVFMKKDAAAYEQMYELIRPAIKDKNVLELATGTGMIAKNIADSASAVEATDLSSDMIEQAERGNEKTNVHFSVQDMFALPYPAETFDAVIVSNALHIVPEPQRALSEIRRVLKDGGTLIAPTFTHAGNDMRGKLKAFFMKLVGFPLHSKWSDDEYLSFLRDNGWTVQKYALLRASFPLTYVECIKSRNSAEV